MTITPLNQNNGIVTQPNVIIGNTGLPIGYVSQPMVIGDPFSPIICQPNVIGNALGVQGVVSYPGCIIYGPWVFFYFNLFGEWIQKLLSTISIENVIEVCLHSFSK